MIPLDELQRLGGARASAFGPSRALLFARGRRAAAAFELVAALVGARGARLLAPPGVVGVELTIVVLICDPDRKIIAQGETSTDLALTCRPGGQDPLEIRAEYEWVDTRVFPQPSKDTP